MSQQLLVRGCISTLIFAITCVTSQEATEVKQLIQPLKHHRRRPIEQRHEESGISSEQYVELKKKTEALQDILEGLSSRILKLEENQDLRKKEKQTGGTVQNLHSSNRSARRRRSITDEEEATDSLQEILAEDLEIVDHTSLNALLKRMDTLEGVMTKTTARSCDAHRKSGIKTSGTYLIDPDGADFGDAPVEVYCNFLDSGESETVISHETAGNDSVSIDHCGSAGCSNHEIKYTVSSGQINALIEISTTCTQEITYECFSAPLSLWGNFHYSWWIGSDGTSKKYYWSGRNTTDHVCSCGLAQNCSAQPVFLKCNCDAGVPEWFSDKGIITEKDDLPIRSLHFGGLKYPTQKAKFSLGPLKCSGANTAFLNKFDSCRAMRILGHRAPGYYVLDSPASTTDEQPHQQASEGKVARVARCNFDLHAQNPLFEETILTLGSSIVFSARRSETAQSSGCCAQLTSFDHVELNRGGGFDSEAGTFTAPLSGVYFFSFLSAHQRAGRYEASRARIHKNGLVYAETLDDDDSQNLRGSMTITTVMELKKGDSVHVSYQGYLRTGGDKRGLQFMGFMLVPL